jgi:hypothetical protein
MRIDSAIITGSFSVNGDTFNDLGVFPSTGSNTFVGNQSIVGAVSASALTGSIDFTNLTNVPTLVSGSEQIVSILSPLNSYTQSNDTTNTTQNSRLTSLESITGSLATTGSNTFIGTQTITGSLFISSNLIVQGSSSLQNITASAVSIGTNIVYLNTDTPAVRFAGLTVQDSGSSAGVTGSMLWDSLCNRWIYSNPSTIGYSGGMLLSGPRASTLGNETTLTCNYVAKSGGGDHLYDSCIVDDGTTTCIKNNLIGTGTACFTGAVCSNYLYSATSIVAGCTLWTGDTIRKLSDNQCIFFRNAAGTVEATISGDGGAIFTRRVTAQNLSVISDSSEQVTITTSADSNKQLIFGRTTTNAKIIAVTQGVGYVPLALQPDGGFVGVACNTPSYLLDVNGSARINGTIIANGDFNVRNTSFSTTGTLNGITWTNLYPSTYNVADVSVQLDGNYYNGAIRFRTADADNANVLVERLRIESRGIACFSNTICAPRATINCLGVNAGWSSGGGAYQPLQVKAGLNNSGVWVESCSVDSGFYINMAGTCAVLGQSYRTSGGYGDIIIQTSGNNRMRIKCEGNVEVQTGIISPMFMIERNSAYDDLTTGCYLNLNDVGYNGLNAKFQQQFAPFVNNGETMTWNYARAIIRITSNQGNFDQSQIGCIRNATYFYGIGYTCFGNHVSVGGTILDGGRGFKWVVMPWFGYADLYGATDVPGFALYNQCSSIPLRIGAVYLQYKA